MPLTASDKKIRDKLVVRRDNIQRALATLKASVAKHQADLASDPDTLQLLVTRTEKTVDHLGEITCELMYLEPDEEHAQIQETVEEEYCSVVTVAKRLIRHRTTEPSLTNSSSQNSPSPYDAMSQRTLFTKLPEQTLPQFDGKYEAWLDFKDDFESLVGKRTDLSDAQKLRYLRTCLKGEPERLLRQHSINDAKYADAWKMLTESFEHKNKILERHFAGIMNIPVLQRESPRELSELVNTIQLHLAALKSLGEPVEKWSSFLVYIIVSKLDKTTRKDWRKTQKGNVVSKYADLIEFLREAVLSGDDWSPTTSSSRDEKSCGQNRGKSGNQGVQNFKGQKRAQCFTTTVTANCPCCKEPHPIARCQQFRTLSAKEKHDAAVKAALCLNCLRPEHKANDCTSKYTCRVCKKKHHSWLHYAESAQPSPAPPSTSQA